MRLLSDSWTNQGLSDRAWRGRHGAGDWRGGGADRGWTDDHDSDELMLNVLRCPSWHIRDKSVVTNAEARFDNSLRPRKPEGSLGRTAQPGRSPRLDRLVVTESYPCGRRVEGVLRDFPLWNRSLKQIIAPTCLSRLWNRSLQYSYISGIPLQFHIACKVSVTDPATENMS